MQKYINSSNIHDHKKPYTVYVGSDIKKVKSQGFVALAFAFKRKHDITL